MSNKSRQRNAAAQPNSPQADAINAAVEQVAEMGGAPDHVVHGGVDFVRDATGGLITVGTSPPDAAEFPDAAKIREVDTGRAPDWQNDAYLLLNEFRAHGGIMQFLQEKSSGLVHPETGQSMLRNLHADDRAACVKLLLPFRADSRVARFCGVAVMTVKEAN